MAALLHASRGAAEFGNPRGADLTLARKELERALEFAHEHDLGYLEVQSLWLLATLATMRGDLRGMAASADQAVAAAVRRGHHPSAWSAGPMAMLAYSDLLGGDPAAAAARAEEALGTWDPASRSRRVPAAGGARRLTSPTRASARRGSPSCARRAPAFGDNTAATSLLAALAVLEHRVALLNGNLGAAAEVAAWLRRPPAGRRREPPPPGVDRVGPRPVGFGRHPRRAVARPGRYGSAALHRRGGAPARRRSSVGCR